VRAKTICDVVGGEANPRRVAQNNATGVYNSRRIANVAPPSTCMKCQTEAAPRCLVPAFDGVIFSHQWKDSLWDRFCTGAPARQRAVRRANNIVK
jgi:hypothetical protein